MRLEKACEIHSIGQPIRHVSTAKSLCSQKILAGVLNIILFVTREQKYIYTKNLTSPAFSMNFGTPKKIGKMKVECPFKIKKTRRITITDLFKFNSYKNL